MVSQFKHILVEKPKPFYVRIKINRPEVLNALNLDSRKEILQALDESESDIAVRAVVITGAGDKAFSAGADINMFQKMTPVLARKYLKISKGAAERIENYPKPVIAAVNGLAIGGGLELAMACDMIIASDNAKFAQGEINVGLIPGVGGTQRLPRLVGLCKAKELVFTGEFIDSAEALRIGLVNKVVPHNLLESETEALVTKLAGKSPIILALAKEALNRSSNGLKDGLDFESTIFAFAFATEDQKEGANAFLAKRKPEFKGN